MALSIQIADVVVTDAPLTLVAVDTKSVVPRIIAIKVDSITPPGEAKVLVEQGPTALGPWYPLATFDQLGRATSKEAGASMPFLRARIHTVEGAARVRVWASAG